MEITSTLRLPLWESKQSALTGQYICIGQQPLAGFYTSPLRRAKDTAAIIGSKLGQIPKLKNEMRELEHLEVPALALCEFLSILDVIEDYLDANAGRPIRWPIEGRVSRVLTELVAEYPNQRIAVVTHSGVISSVLAWFFPEQRFQWWIKPVSNCSLTRLAVEGVHAELLALEETKHLSPEVSSTKPPSRAVQVAKKLQQTVSRQALKGE